MSSAIFLTLAYLMRPLLAPWQAGRQQFLNPHLAFSLPHQSLNEEEDLRGGGAGLSTVVPISPPSFKKEVSSSRSGVGAHTRIHLPMVDGWHPRTRCRMVATTLVPRLHFVKEMT